jgi:Ca-activated chloride channel family protein
MRGRLIVIALAVVAVAAAAISSLAGGGGDNGSGSGQAPAGATRVSFALSPEKEQLLKPLIARFNNERHKVGGAPVFVDASVVSSGDAETRIARGRLRPTAWSPASSLWGRLLDFDADRRYVPDDNPSLVRTPLVIAMWEPLARTLGWPRKQVGWAQVLRLATSPQGWAAYGKPEYGAFKLGHTNPDFSTAGLSAVAAEYFTATGKREGLTRADVSRPDVRRRIRDIERSIVHYGDTTLFFSDQMARYGPAYASAVAVEEATLIDFNRRHHGTRLVGLYPPEGTFVSDNPFIVLDAPWVGARQRAAARAFGTWLREHLTAAVAARGGFRPGDPNARPQPPIDAAHGADPSEPRRVLAPPEPEVLAEVKRLWRQDRKPANVAVVVDTSGSMGEEDKLVQAQQGLRVFLRQFEPADRVSLVGFNSRVYRLVALGQIRTSRGRLRSAVDGMLAQGETALYDAVADAFDQIRALHDPTRINAIVVLSDGRDTASQSSVDTLTRALDAQARSEGLAVRVYTIAYGNDADHTVLDSIAKASGGRSFAGDPQGISSVYLSISSFF